MMASRTSWRSGVVLMASVVLSAGVGVAGTAGAQERRPIVIGASVAATGQLGLVGTRMREGYLWWQDQLNRRGGLLGRPVEFKFYDDRSDPGTGAKLYEKLITDDKVDAVLGPFHSSVTAAIAPIVEKHRMPMVASGASSLSIFGRGYKNIFMTIGPAPEYVRGILELGRKLGLTVVGVIGENLSPYKDYADLTDKMTKELGMRLVVREEYPSKIMDFTAPLMKLRAARPEMLIGATNFPDSVNMARQMKDLDVDVKLFFSTGGPALPEFYKNLGKTAEFVYGVSQWEPKQAGYPGHKEFVSSFTKMFGHEPDYYNMMGAKGAAVLQLAVERVGSLDNDKIREALRTMKVITAWGPYVVDERGVQIAHKMVVTQWQDGKNEVVWPEDQATAKPRFPTLPWRERK